MFSKFNTIHKYSQISTFSKSQTAERVFKKQGQPEIHTHTHSSNKIIMAKINNLGILLLAVASLVLIPHTTEAEEHIVQWIIPSHNQTTSFYPNLVANIKFRVNDVLVFNFTTGSHNVATLPKKKDFDDCNMSDTSEIIVTGPARIKLDHAGEYYFACQFPFHCSLGQKLSINVTGNGSSSSPSPAVAPSSPAPSMSVTSALSFLLMAISINVLF